ncbi:hypothetical protein A0H81_12996 [Grifola frondosa]|uniref:Uncharacterized protein n=1 Tax=Grifola frondosa TaxID=5627 RepID=A0A1C7LQJ9_GRIFR|nr:hypothetical protein A0H81_12996 [Grifola frondosa]
MAVKRKFDAELEDASAPSQNAKQAKLIPFPTSHLDTDVAMLDASISDLEPLTIPMQSYHNRFPSDASYSSSSASDSPRDSPIYPTFDLYPHDDDSYMGITSHGLPDPTANVPVRPVGLLQPKGPFFAHHGQNCSQIPKLRVACSPGLNGQRTMWAHCEQCGAIEMVDTD